MRTVPVDPASDNAPEGQRGQEGKAAIAGLALALLLALGVVLYLRNQEPEGPTEPDVPPTNSTSTTATTETVEPPVTTTAPDSGTQASDSEFTLHGVVRDEAGAALEGVAIEWRRYADILESAAAAGGMIAPSYSTTSGADGTFAVQIPVAELEPDPALTAQSGNGDASDDEGAVDQMALIAQVSASRDGYGVAVRPVYATTAAQRIEFVLKLAATVSGYVRDQANGRGVAGVQVWASAGRATTGLRALANIGGGLSAQSDENGYYFLNALEPGEYVVRISSGESGYAVDGTEHHAITVVAGEDLTDYDFEVKPGGSIGGIALLPDGTPAVGANIMAQPKDAMQRQMTGDVSTLSFRDKGARTGDDGRFLIDGLPIDEKYTVTGQHDDVAPLTVSDVAITTETPDVQIELQFLRGSTIYGMVTDEGGSIARDVNVHLMPDLAAIMAGNLQLSQLGGQRAPDEAGRYEFQRLPAGKYRVFTNPQDSPDDNVSNWADMWGDGRGREVEVDGEQDYEVNLTVVDEIAEVVTVTGQVVDDQGQPVAGATVAGNEAGTQTDADGNFELTLSGRAAIPLRANAVGYEATSTSVVPAQPHTVIALNRLASISGRVALPDGAGPGVSFVVRVQDAGQGLLGAYQQIAIGNTPQRGAPDGSFVVSNVTSGSKEVVVQVPGYAEGVSKVLDVRPGAQITDVVIELIVGGSLTGHVLLPEGAPAAGASVVLVPAGLPESQKLQYYYMGSAFGHSGHAQATSDGSYELRNLRPGLYELRATHRVVGPSEIQQVRIGDGAAERNLILTPGATIAGQVTRDGKGVAGAMIQAIGGTSAMRQGQADPEGRFEFKGLGPGEYVLNITDMSGVMSGKGMLLKYHEVTIDGSETRSVEVEIGGGVSVRGRLEGIVGRVAMIQVRRKGGPLPEELDMMDVAAQVESNKYLAGMCILQRDGEFQVAGVQPGEYLLEVPFFPDNPADVGAYINADRTPFYRAEIKVGKKDLVHDIIIRRRD